jgi:hypothetical protein
MSFRYNDERRLEMAAQGFAVRQLQVDSETHEVTSVWYVYEPDDAAKWLQSVTPLAEDGHHGGPTPGRPSLAPASAVPRAQGIDCNDGRQLFVGEPLAQHLPKY